MQKHAPDISDDAAIGGELERPTIGVESLRRVKKNIGIDEVRADRSVVGNRQRILTERLAENAVGENDRIYSIARIRSHWRVQHAGGPDALNVLVPHVQGWRDGVVPCPAPVLETA